MKIDGHTQTYVNGSATSSPTRTKQTQAGSRDVREEIFWATTQIRDMTFRFEGRKTPDWAVGAIQGWCNKIDRLLAAQ
jgi:hypothetical protein